MVLFIGQLYGCMVAGRWCADVYVHEISVVLPGQIKVASCQYIKINNDAKSVCRYMF